MRRIARLTALVISLMALLVGMDAYAAAPPSRPGALPVAQGPAAPGHARHPLWLKVRGYDAHGHPLFTSTQPVGYTPQQIAAYLGLKGQGSGQTIAIVDAYGSPAIASDLATFDSTFGLQAPPSFVQATPQGSPKSNAGWALETSLDVEWAHAVAPKAAILLVEAAGTSTRDLMSAIDYAAAQAGVVAISNSWGMSEFSGETADDAHCALAAAVCTFASGDSGNPGFYPAYNPHVIAVGGTTLDLSATGAFVSETAWSGSGGGVSQYEARPGYQAQVNTHSGRGIPDVSYDANPNTGFAVYDSVRYQGQSGWFEVGGTSAGAPQWAAIVAAADQLRQAAGLAPLGSSSLQADSQLYGLTTGLQDVTAGSNGNCGSICDAGPGYDFVTGLGSPEPGIDTALAASSAGVTASGASLSPASQSATVAAGGTANYTYTLTNDGSASATFDLTAASPAGWNVSVSPASVTVAGNGGTATVQLTVTAGTTAGAGDTETLTATSGSTTASATATTTVASPAATSSALQPVAWSTSGGKGGTKNLDITLTLLDDLGNPVSGASIAVSLDRNGAAYASGTGTTGSNGSAGFTLHNAPAGTYTLTVTGVNATPPWNGAQPANASFTK